MGMPISCNKCNIILGGNVNLSLTFSDLGFGEFRTIHYGVQYRGQQLIIIKEELKEFEEFMKREKIIKNIEKAKINLKKFEDEDGDYSITPKILENPEEDKTQFIENICTLRVYGFYKNLYNHCVAHLNNGTKEITIETLQS